MLSFGGYEEQPFPLLPIPPKIPLDHRSTRSQHALRLAISQIVAHSEAYKYATFSNFSLPFLPHIENHLSTMPTLGPLFFIVFRIMVELCSGPYQQIVAYSPQAHELFDAMAASFHTATDLAYNGFTAWNFAVPSFDSSYRIVGQDVLKYSTAPRALAVAAVAATPRQFSVTLSGLPVIRISR